MASFTNVSKSSDATLTNKSKSSGADLTWADMSKSWANETKKWQETSIITWTNTNKS